MGSHNQSMWRELGISGRYGKVSCNVSHSSGSSTKIFVLADVPHLIKNLRQAFLTHKTFTISDNTVRKHKLPSNKICISHVKDLLEFQKKKDLKIAPSLTDVVLAPGQFDKMKVSQALHLFSRSVSSGLRFLIEKEGRDKSYLSTAWFIDMVNTWFDLMSSRHPVMALSKRQEEKYNQSIQFLQSVVEDVCEMSLDSKGKWKPVQTGFLLSTTSIITLAEILLKDQPYILTARFTQDCLENLFSTIRLKGPTPSPAEFKMHLKLVTVAQFLKCSSHSNYDIDDSDYLADFLQTLQPTADTSQEVDSDFNDIMEYDLGEDEENALYYLAGYCVRSLKRTNQLNCTDCLSQATSTDPPTTDVGYLTSLKEYKTGVLCHPSQAVYDVCRIAEDVIRSNENSLVSKPNVVTAITKQVEKSRVIPAMCHDIVRRILQKFVLLRVKILCRKLTKLHTATTKPSFGSKSVAMRHLAKKVNSQNV